MPGLIGTLKKKDYNRNDFNYGLSLLNYNESDKIYDIFEDKFIIASRAHLGIIGTQHSSYIQDDLILWIEGEIYNERSIGSGSVNKSICDAHLDRSLNQILREIDGYYSAVLYDSNRQEIKIWTDRYGLKPLYYENSTNFSWSSELKAFKRLSSINLDDLDYSAIEYFIEHGQFVGDRTYFNNIKLLNASTVVTYDIRKKKFESERYWKWGYVHQQRITFKEASKELYSRINSSMSTRLGGKNKTQLGLTLSGGIDSRVLLSLAPPGIQTITFGTIGCIDNQVAQKVARKNSNPHKLFELNSSNWIDGRIEAVKITDGMFNMQHMHSAPFLKEFQKYYNININGFAGDLNVGGGWINEPNKRISSESIAEKFGDISEFIDYSDTFYDSPHEDPFHLDVRLRRFTVGGTIQNSTTIEQVKPFYSNEIMEFIYSLPDEYRVNGRLYQDMILNHMPQLFKNIHTTHNIFPLGRENDLLYKLRLKYQNGLIKLGVRPNYKWHYTSYKDWYIENKFKVFRRKISSDILLEKLPKIHNYTNFIKSDEIDEKDLSKAFAFITAEIWLRYFFDIPFPTNVQ